MNKIKHTPGPWRISNTEIYGSEDIHVHGRLWPVVPGQGQVSSRSFTSRVCVVEGSPELEGPAANARLIAAAPDLLEVCHELLHEVETSHIDWARFNYGSLDYDPEYKPEFPACVNKARATIAKAERREP